MYNQLWKEGSFKIIIYIYIYEVKSLQNLQNFNYFTNVRGIIQNVWYCLFSTDLNNIFNIKDVYSPHKKIVEFIKTTRSKVYTPLILNTVLLSEWCTAVFISLVIVVHESLSVRESSGLTNYLVFQDFCVFEPFPTMTVWFWDPLFHTEDDRETHM